MAPLRIHDICLAMLPVFRKFNKLFSFLLSNAISPLPNLKIPSLTGISESAQAHDQPGA